MNLKTSILILLILFSFLSAQIITSEPPFPTENDSIVIYFDATQGDQGLMNYSGNDVYAHTGVITNYSTSPSDWKYVIAPWNVNVSKAKCEKVGTNLYKLVIGYPREYYGMTDPNETIEQLAFVFRNSTGTVTGRDVNGADIFYRIYHPGITIKLNSPTINNNLGDPLRTPLFVGDTSIVHVEATAAVVDTKLDSLFIYVNDQLVQATNNDTIVKDVYGADLTSTINLVKVLAVDTSGRKDSLEIALVKNPPIVDQKVPAGIEPGINYTSSSSVTLCLFAPYKKFVYVLGDFNDWKVDPNYFMKRDSIAPDSILFWLDISNLTPGAQYGFQYLVDGKIRVTDPYAELVLDPWNDSYIDANTFPNLKPYPTGKTTEIVGVFQPGKPSFNWTDTNYHRPPKEKLVIYELLVRDFIQAHNYQTLIDTLNYLANLGINAIELMPINEFEGNISWGYNPSFYLAPDKYYGTPEALKQFINEAHRRGIAVIMDVVFNHAFGQCPLVRLYSDGNYGPPSANNPWFNQSSPHPLGVGYDFNHESPHTKYFVKRATQYWIQEYHVDGYRFDLSKGFTNRYSGNDYNLWSQYDASRIAILKGIADNIWAVDDSAYVILEHFADNTEEKELANYGMMLWSNMNRNYSQSAMGWISDNTFPSNLDIAYYKNRGWTVPNNVVYMESHDEEWLNFRNLAYGRSNSSNGYNIKDLATALNRMKLVGAFFFTIPGPKMMWQFGELGYDEPLEEGNPSWGRTDPKPIHWEYYQDSLRKKLYETWRWLIKLRNENEVFTSTATQVSMRVGQGIYDRRINLTHPSMDVTIIGNFNVDTMMVNPNFQTTGWWYDYFNGDSIYVTDTQSGIKLRPGEFRIYTTKKLQGPTEDVLLDIDKDQPIPVEYSLDQNYPNPFNPTTTIRYKLKHSGKVSLTIYNIAGQKIRTLVNEFQNAGQYTVQWDARDRNGVRVPSGIYFYRLKTKQFTKTRKMILLK